MAEESTEYILGEIRSTLFAMRETQKENSESQKDINNRLMARADSHDKRIRVVEKNLHVIWFVGPFLVVGVALLTQLKRLFGTGG